MPLKKNQMTAPWPAWIGCAGWSCPSSISNCLFFRVEGLGLALSIDRFTRHAMPGLCTTMRCLSHELPKKPEAFNFMSVIVFAVGYKLCVPGVPHAPRDLHYSGSNIAQVPKFLHRPCFDPQTPECRGLGVAWDYCNVQPFYSHGTIGLELQGHSSLRPCYLLHVNHCDWATETVPQPSPNVSVVSRGPYPYEVQGQAGAFMTLVLPPKKRFQLRAEVFKTGFRGGFEVSGFRRFKAPGLGVLEGRRMWGCTS